MKKKMCVWMLLTFITIYSAVSKEINLGPDKENGLFNEWIYYNDDYRLDWETFYARMSKIANSGQYKYFYVVISTTEANVSKEPLDVLRVSITDSTYGMPNSAIFYYIQKNGRYMMMILSNEFNTDTYNSYNDAVKAWNNYLDFM